MTTADGIKKIIKDARAVKNSDRLNPELPLTAQGVDSLELVSIFLAIEETLNIKVSDEEMAGLHSIQDIVNFLNKK